MHEDIAKYYGNPPISKALIAFESTEETKHISPYNLSKWSLSCSFPLGNIMVSFFLSLLEHFLHM